MKWVLVPRPRPESAVHDDPAQLHVEGPRSILRLSGDLDMATAPAVRIALIDACRDCSREEVIVDLSDVPFFDAVAAGIFAQAHHRLTVTGGRLTLIGLSRHQEKVLRLCRLEHLFSPSVTEPAP